MYSKEDYIEKGYVFHGYFPPELSSESEYPDYIKEEAQDSIKKLNSIKSDNTTSFAFMADLHYAPMYNHHIRLTRAVNAYKEIAKNTNVDKVVLGGDLGANGTKDFTKKSFVELMEHFNGEKCFTVLGNHDDNSLWQTYIESEKSDTYFTHNELYDMLLSHLPKLSVNIDDKNKATYYYYDEVETKTRYVILDTTDIPYILDEGNLRYTGQHTYAISQKQVDWLINEALVFDDSDWSVVFFTHNIDFPKNHDSSHLKPMTEIIKAYKKGEDLNAVLDEGDFAVTVSADFSKRKRADVVAVFLGHFHCDIETVDDAGVNYIAIGNATMYNHGEYIRTDGIKDEILFDAVTVDKENRTIHMIRVGYGEDRTVKY